MRPGGGPPVFRRVLWRGVGSWPLCSRAIRPGFGHAPEAAVFSALSRSFVLTFFI